MTRFVSVALGAILTVSCAPALMKLPTGQTIPLRPEVIAQIASPCKMVPMMTAEVAVSGSVARQRVRARLLAGLSGADKPRRRPEAVRIEAVAPFGAPLFVFVAQDEDATLLLPRDDRYLEHAPPEKVLDALVGVPLTTSDLVQMLTRCYDFDHGAEARAAGDKWVIVAIPHDFDLYYQRDAPSGPYRIAAATHRRANGVDWRVEYRNYQNDRPLTIRLTSVDAGGRAGSAFDLTLGLSQIGSGDIDPSAFRLEIPPSARRITLDELRNARAGIRQG